MLSASTSMVLVFAFRSLIQLEFIFMWRVRYGSTFIFSQMATQLFQLYFLESPFLPQELEMTLYQYSKFPNVPPSILGLFVLFYSPGLFVYLCTNTAQFCYKGTLVCFLFSCLIKLGLLRFSFSLFAKIFLHNLFFLYCILAENV